MWRRVEVMVCWSCSRAAGRREGLHEVVSCTCTVLAFRGEAVRFRRGSAVRVLHCKGRDACADRRQAGLRQKQWSMA